jgi:hypothetical protein
MSEFPFKIEYFPVGQDARQTPYKMYKDGSSCCATAEEVQAWEYVEFQRSTIKTLAEQTEKKEGGKSKK